MGAVELFSLACTLFLLMDSVGNIPIFLSVLREVPPTRQRKIILRELLIALAVILLFSSIGEMLLHFLHISMATTLIAGGIILFLIALKMVFHGPPEAKSAHAPHKEPFIVPLAIPLVAGPAVLAAVMLYADRQEISLQVLTGAVLLAWIASAAVLLSASLWSRLLGPRGLIACERLMGLILTLISIQMLLDGIKLFLIPCAA